MCCLILTIAATPAFAQQPAMKAGESHKYRTIMTVAGGAGGFTLGVFAGIAMFEDSINSDRKAWTTAIVSAGAGAVGGYFIGRALDRRNNKKAGLGGDGLMVSPLLSRDTQGVAFSLRF
jgi:hypothetical protein